jgi:putative transposase
MHSSYRHKRTSVTLINYHFVWIPRRRRPVLSGSVAARLEVLIHEMATALDCSVVDLDVMPDHVHLFLDAPPTLAPDQIMFRLKVATAHVLRREFPHLLKLPSMWTRSYFCSTAGHVSSETIRRYIAEQKAR